LAPALLLAVGATASPAASGGAAATRDGAARSEAEWIEEGHRQKATGNLDLAEAAFMYARAAGFEPQRVELELGYLASRRGDANAARSHFTAAARGPDLELASLGKSELVESWLQEVPQARHRGDLAGARAAVRSAQEAGADQQRIDLERGYLALAENAVGNARHHLSHAVAGPDPRLTSMARAQLGLLPGRVWRDFYSDVYGWDRAAGGNPSSDAVPTLRVRALYRLSFETDLSLYLLAQVTRDLSSRGASTGRGARVYADNYALVGPGFLLRLWERRLGLFFQLGPAFNLLGDGRPRSAFDARGGAYLSLETSRSWPSPLSGPSSGFIPCADLYSEAVYLSRLGHNAVAFTRGTAGATWLVTGPVAWQLVGELRAVIDRNHDFYNN
jgi:hypothetical protein